MGWNIQVYPLASPFFLIPLDLRCPHSLHTSSVTNTSDREGERDENERGARCGSIYGSYGLLSGDLAWILYKRYHPHTKEEE